MKRRVKRLEGEGRVLYRYCSADGVVDENSNINGAAHSIAGIVNERGNVLGMMPHPENHVEDIMGCTDGRGLFAGLVAHLETRGVNFNCGDGCLRLSRRCCVATAAYAQDFPKRPVTMIVPFAAGGTSDVIARTVAEEMGKALGQPIVIENVAGAGGSTALARAARAEPDGYTIAIGNAGTSAATYTIYPKLPFTPDSFVPIAMVAKTFGIVALRKDFPAKNLQEFIAYAKKNPGKINLGHAGIGSSNFLICKSFVQAAGIDVTLVGYRGARACADGCDRRPDRRRLRRGRFGVAGDRRQTGAGASSSARRCGLRPCPICRRRRKPAFPNSRRRAGTACSRQRARRLRSSRN